MDTVVALPLHGVAHTDDLGVQAFARHLAVGDRGRPIIAGMRAFLEGKPDLLPDPPWSQPPATGYRAVTALAEAAGCPPDRIEHARRASRHDVAGSAWILDPADGFEELLDRLVGRAAVLVLADPDDPATGPVLDALELAGRVTVVDDVVPVGRGGPTMVIDTAWTPRLAAAHQAGHGTALIDRFGSVPAGRPDLRAPDLPGLLGGVIAWLDAHTTDTPTTGSRSTHAHSKEQGGQHL